MKRLLNTLYVTIQGSYLSRQGETVKVRVNNDTKLRVPIHTLGSIVCFGQVSCSPFLMALCAERGVGLSFLSERGRFLARVQGPVNGNVLVRRAHYRLAESQETCAEVARAIVAAKTANCRNVLLRAVRDNPTSESSKTIADAAERLKARLRNLQRPMSLDTVRGIEGDAARIYFAVFDHLITGDKKAFSFQQRSRRPPLDNVNALLSFLYTILAHDVCSALESFGLDPAVGFLHRDRPGRPSLALDLMEDLRPHLVDRLVLSIINRRQIKGTEFETTESGAVQMNDETRKEVIVAYQKRKQETLRHPFIEEKIPIGLLAYVQAQLMARYIRAELDAYPPFFWR